MFVIIKMGIKDLSKFLRDKYPDIFELIHISDYHFRRVAIDTSLYLCQYKSAYNNPDNPNDFTWLGAFIKLVACLRENEIHCVFIYDSSSPPEKEAEKKERGESRRKLEERVCRLEDAIDRYHSSGEIDDILIEFQSKRKLEQNSLLRPNNINIHGIQFAVKKLRKQLFSVSPQDFAVTKQLFDILQVPYFNAPVEAETMCADLCIQGKVDAVLSEDTDVLAYGAHTFLTKVNTGDGTCMRIKYADVLKKMGMTSDEFLDFCIMCGTDYNKNIFKVGPVKAQKLIETYKSIDVVGDKTNLDISILNHKRTRQLFREYQKSEMNVPYCGCPDFNALQQFVVKRNLRLGIESLRKSFIHNIVVFEDDEKSDEDEIIILEDD
jgi:5'-3' exonuclease